MDRIRFLLEFQVCDAISGSVSTLYYNIETDNRAFNCKGKRKRKKR